MRYEPNSQQVLHSVIFLWFVYFVFMYSDGYRFLIAYGFISHAKDYLSCCYMYLAWEILLRSCFLSYAKS